MHYLSVIIDNNQRRPLSSLCTNGNLQPCKTLKMKTTSFLSSVVFHNKTFIFTFLKQHLIYQYSSCPLSSKYLIQKRTFRKVTEFSSLQILQSGCNPRHLNSRAFLDCSGLHLDYMDYKVIKWIAEQYNPKQSKGNLCNPSAIHCNLGLQFCFAIQINLCNLTAIQEDCSLIAEIAVRLLRLQKFRNLHIHIPAPIKVSGMLLGVLF